jgi:hypothetical protein
LVVVEAAIDMFEEENGVDDIGLDMAAREDECE